MSLLLSTFLQNIVDPATPSRTSSAPGPELQGPEMSGAPMVTRKLRLYLIKRRRLPPPSPRPGDRVIIFGRRGVMVTGLSSAATETGAQKSYVARFILCATTGTKGANGVLTSQFTVLK